jgi:hypothetical protein
MKAVDLISKGLIIGLILYLIFRPTYVDNSFQKQILLELRQANEENKIRDSVNHELLIENNKTRELDRQRTNKTRDENIQKLSSPDLTNDELRRKLAE